MAVLEAGLKEHAIRLGRRLPDWRATARGVRADHRLLLDAIREGNTDSAATLAQKSARYCNLY